jgi:hypothetical protein
MVPLYAFILSQSQSNHSKTRFIKLWFLLIDGAGGCPEFLQTVQDFLRLSNFRKTFGLSQARKYDIATKVSRISDTTLRHRLPGFLNDSFPQRFSQFRFLLLINTNYCRQSNRSIALLPRSFVDIRVAVNSYLLLL